MCHNATLKYYLNCPLNSHLIYCPFQDEIVYRSEEASRGLKQDKVSFKVNLFAVGMHKSCCSGFVYNHYMVKHEFRLIVLHSGNNIVYLFSNLPVNSTKLLLKAKSLILFHFIKVVTFCTLSPSGWL